MEQTRVRLPPLDDDFQASAGSNPQALDQLLDQRKSLHPPYPPPSYSQSHDAASLAFPQAPTTELAPIQPRDAHADANSALPPLSAVTGTQSHPPFAAPPSSSGREQAHSPPPPPPSSRGYHWPSLNPLTAYYTPGFAQSEGSPSRTDADAGGSGAVSTASPDRQFDGRGSSVSLDDPDVRLAAEALGDLRAGASPYCPATPQPRGSAAPGPPGSLLTSIALDFVSSPRNAPTPLPSSPRSTTSQQQPEPLLSLLTTSHPLLAKTIEGTTSAYNTSKNFSPRFKTGAEYVEGYLTPIGNTLGSVSRVTGVEGGVRWFLGAGRRHHQHPSSDLEAGVGGGANKRRKVAADAGDDGPAAAGAERAAVGPAADVDLFGFTKDRRLSMSTIDTLPAYDDVKSPAYSESLDAHQTEQSQLGTRGAAPSGPAAWQSRLIMSTSGLSIAMSEESLRSLKYCLRWLRWANDHIAKVIRALKTALDQYDRTDPARAGGARRGGEDMDVDPCGDASAGTSPPPSQDRGEIAARIAALKGDVLKTLRDVIETVSRYAGGSLPDNARDLVRRHLTSLPQRFRLASRSEATSDAAGGGGGRIEHDREMKDGAQRVLVLAKEGLDMMSQVSGVLDGTIVSAEEWCERLGRKTKGDERQQIGGESSASPSDPPDITMR